MKRIILILFLFIFSRCEEKPVRDFYGFAEEEKSVLLMGLLSSKGYSNTDYGSVVDSYTGLEIKKCSQGQIYNPATAGCDPGSGNLVTNGALRLSYCHSVSNLCNSDSIPYTLKDPGSITSSEIYNSCSSDRTGGYSNWRVPALFELVRLASFGRNSLLQFFPSTLEDYYWSANAEENDLYGKTAKTVSFSAQNFGETRNFSKDTRLYVRCVRNR